MEEATIAVIVILVIIIVALIITAVVLSVGPNRKFKEGQRAFLYGNRSNVIYFDQIPTQISCKIQQLATAGTEGDGDSEYSITVCKLNGISYGAYQDVMKKHFIAPCEIELTNGQTQFRFAVFYDGDDKEHYVRFIKAYDDIDMSDSDDINDNSLQGFVFENIANALMFSSSDDKNVAELVPIQQIALKWNRQKQNISLMYNNDGTWENMSEAYPNVPIFLENCVFYWNGQQPIGALFPIILKDKDFNNAMLNGFMGIQLKWKDNKISEYAILRQAKENLQIIQENVIDLDDTAYNVGDIQHGLGYHQMFWYIPITKPKVTIEDNGGGQ